MKPMFAVGAALATLLVLVAALSQPAKLAIPTQTYPTALPPTDAGSNLVPGTEARVLWRQRDVRTARSVVYLHGFSASRQETAPLAERVAEALDANLFEARLSGHGLTNDALVDVTAEDWLDDTLRALAAGEALGERSVVIATSTGATLLAALIDHPQLRSVEAFVFLSPNFGLRNRQARFSTGPGGKILTRLLAGEFRSWTAYNDLQERFWTTRYPSAALIELVRVLDLAEKKLSLPSAQRWLVLYSNRDEVISPQAIERLPGIVDTAELELLEIANPGDPSGHILAGDILSPETTEPIAAHIVEFIRRPQP